jgi:hypothetical protein
LKIFYIHFIIIIETDIEKILIFSISIRIEKNSILLIFSIRLKKFNPWTLRATSKDVLMPGP